MAKIKHTVYCNLFNEVVLTNLLVWAICGWRSNNCMARSWRGFWKVAGKAIAECLEKNKLNKMRSLVIQLAA